MTVPNIYIDAQTSEFIRRLAESQERTVAAVVKRAVKAAYGPADVAALVEAEVTEPRQNVGGAE